MIPSDPINDVLQDLQRALSNTLTMVTTALEMRRNSAHLLSLTRSMMVDLGEHIEQALATIPDEEEETHV